MRYSLSEGAYILGKFNIGATVTISLYKASDNSSVPLTSNACSHLAEGVYKWNTSNITTQPTAFIEYCWVMTDGTSSQYGKVVLGGYPDNCDSPISDIPTASENADAVYDELESGHTLSGSFGKAITDIKKIQKNGWKVVNNQFIIYDDDGTTPLLTYNLLDSEGNLTELNPYERQLT